MERRITPTSGLLKLVHRFRRPKMDSDDAVNQSLTHWLGLPSANRRPPTDIPVPVQLKTPEKLSELEKNAIWAKIAGHQHVLTIQEAPPQKSLVFNARKWLFSAPAMSLAALLLIAILYKPISHYFQPENSSAAGLILSFKSPETDQKLVSQDRDISIQPYIQAHTVLEKADLTQSLTFWMRGVNGLTASQAKIAAHENLLQISFLTGDLLINFHPAKNPKNDFQKIQVRDQAITFEIIGTEFIVSKAQDRTWLLVNEGKVRTSIAGSTFVVEAAGLWTGPNGKLHRLPDERIKTFFAEFKNGNIKNINLDLLTRFNPAKPEIKTANDSKVILHSGQMVAGKIIFSDESKIIVQTKSTGSFEILRTDIKEIIEMPRNK